MKKIILGGFALALVLTLVDPIPVFADDPVCLMDNTNSLNDDLQINPTFLVQEDDCIVVAFSDTVKDKKS